MARTKTLPIRVNEHELATFETMAQMEKLPVGTFIRRRLLFEADQRGIVPRYGDKAKSDVSDRQVTANAALP